MTSDVGQTVTPFMALELSTVPGTVLVPGTVWYDHVNDEAWRARETGQTAPRTTPKIAE